MIYIGIDPGQSGGVAAIYPDGTYTTIAYDDKAFIDLMVDTVNKDSVKAIVEKVGAMPKQGTRWQHNNVLSF